MPELEQAARRAWYLATGRDYLNHIEDRRFIKTVPQFEFSQRIFANPEAQTAFVTRCRAFGVTGGHDFRDDANPVNQRIDTALAALGIY